MRKINKIVLVDDDKVYLFLASKIVQNMFPDASIKTCHNGQEALEFIKNETPDLLFLDINMPIMNGWDFLNEVNRQEIPIKFPIHIVTSSIDIEDKAKAEMINLVKGYIVKPLDNQKLEDFVSIMS